MDQRGSDATTHPGRRKQLDLDDAPELDASEEVALDAIRRQIDEEFGEAAVERLGALASPERRLERTEPAEREAGPEAVVETEPGPVSDVQARPRPAPDDGARYAGEQQRPRLAAEERPRLAAEERPRLAAEERPRLAAEERPRLAAEERPRLAAEERPRLAAEERPRLAAEERPRLAPEERPLPRPHFDNQLGSRSTLEERLRPRPRTDAELRPRSTLEERLRARPPLQREERSRGERPRVARTPHDGPRREPPSRAVTRDGVERFPPRRIPAQWREIEPPPSPEERPRRGLFVTFALVAGLAGGVVGALLTVLFVTGGPTGSVRQSWEGMMEAARDSGLADIARAVVDRSIPAAPEPRPTPSDAATRRGPIATADIPAPAARGERESPPAEAGELRDLVNAGRQAYVRKDYETAELLFAKAVERSLDDGLLRYHHAIALMGLGRFAEARAELQNALRLGVDSAVALEARAALEQMDTRRRRR